MKKIYVSLEEFKKKIIEADDYCFICLEHKSSKEFNEEHVIPKWILKHFKLFNQKITLPNTSKFTYGGYVIPCCKECNSKLSDVYETPISKLLKKPFIEIIEEISQDKNLIIKLYHWLALIFIKTHIKTTFLNEHQNIKLGKGKIGDKIEWEYLHHIYLMSRTHFTNAKIDRNVYGSILIFKALNGTEIENFDYADSSVSRCVLLKINEFSIICCFDDGGSGSFFIDEKINKIEESFHPLQLREILAHLSYLNVNLKERPIFQSRYNKNTQMIEAKIPDSNPALIDKELQQFQIGDFLAIFADNYLTGHKDKQKLLNEMKEGKRAYLFDINGDFYSMKKTVANNGYN
jgi:hypothetical protein